MKYFILATVGTVMMSSAAFAQDNNTGRNNWGGFYGGVSAGFGSADIDTLFDPTFSGGGWWTLGGPGAANFDPDGAVVGVHFGYDHMLSENWYVGIEGSLNDSSMKQSIASPAFPTIDTWTAEINNYWTVVGRVGYAMEKVSVYGSVGLAGANVKSTAAPPIDISEEHHTGWTAGAGVEYMIRPGLTVGLDYKYLDFGSELHLSDTASCGVCARPGDNRNVDVSAQVITARISLGF